MHIIIFKVVTFLAVQRWRGVPPGWSWEQTYPHYQSLLNYLLFATDIAFFLYFFVFFCLCRPSDANLQLSCQPCWLIPNKQWHVPAAGCRDAGFERLQFYIVPDSILYCQATQINESILITEQNKIHKIIWIIEYIEILALPYRCVNQLDSTPVRVVPAKLTHK